MVEDATFSPTASLPVRRWMRYSLRTLLIALSTVAVLLGWWVNRVQRQRDAVLAIQGRKGDVTYNYYRDDRQQWPAPKWAVKRFGRDCFDTVTRVDLSFQTASPDDVLTQVGHLPEVWWLTVSSNVSATDSGVAHLSGLRKLVHLGLASPKITDESLKIVGHMSRLEELGLYDCDITDEGLFYLRDLKNLRELGIGFSDASVTDAGIAHLRQLTNLERLTLQRTKVTGHGLQAIAGFSKLERLNLSRSHVEDSGIAWIAKLPALEQLSLDHTRVTDVGVAALGGHQALQFVDLRQTTISDAAIPHLAKLPNLEVLDVANSQVTAAGLEQLQTLTKLRLIWIGRNLTGDIARLQQALPKCQLGR